MSALLQDLGYGFRTLRRSPGFTLVTVGVLALGIGANAALYSLVQAVLLRPLPWPDPERLVAVWETIERPDVERRAASYPDFEDWRQRSRSFEGLAAIAGASFTLSGEGDAEQLSGEAVSASYFRVLGVRPALGRGFSAEEDAGNGSRAVAVISHGLWKERFGADPAVISREVLLDGRPTTVIGVMGEGFGGRTDQARIWVALTGPHGAPEERLRARGARWLAVTGRLGAGVSVEAAAAELSRIAADLEREHPDSNRNRGVAVLALSEDLVGELRPALTALLGVVGFVLLIACANVASLSLTRAVGRRRELAVRAALGAGRGRLQRQLLTESLLLALAGGALGLLLADWATSAMLAASPVPLPSFIEVVVDRRVLAVTLGLSVVTGLLAGVAPAWTATRRGLESSLRDGARGSGGSSRLRSGLVVAELALAMVLLVGAGLMVRSFAALRGVDPGVDTERVVTLRLALPDRGDDGASAAAFATALLDEVRALPGVEGAALGSDAPLSGDYSATLVRIVGRDDATQDGAIRVYRHVVSPGYFEVLGVPLLSGRDFTPVDPGPDADTGVCVVSRRFARRHFAGESPLGHHVRYGSRDYAIVGVAGDVDFRDLGEPETADPDLYFAMSQFPRLNPRLVVRSAQPAAALLEPLRDAVRRLDPGVPLYAASTMRERLDAQRADARFASTLFAAFAVLALGLAGMGLYGVLGYSVAQRRREIGTRVALGATPGEVTRLLLARGARLALAGLGLGLLGALALTRLLESLLVEVRPTDATTYLATSVLLAAVAGAATWAPARRATRVDPIEVLRSE